MPVYGAPSDMMDDASGGSARASMRGPTPPHVRRLRAKVESPFYGPFREPRSRRTHSAIAAPPSQEDPDNGARALRGWLEVEEGADLGNG